MLFMAEGKLKLKLVTNYQFEITVQSMQLLHLPANLFAKIYSHYVT